MKVCGYLPKRGDFMRYKASLIICALITVALGLSFFFTPEVVTSKVENRNMTTFKMIFNPVDDIDPNTGEKSVLYNADKSIPDRLEDAMKDQIFIRDYVVLNYTELEAKLSNLYLGTTKTLSAFLKDNTPPAETVPAETDAPVTVPDEGFPDEYYDLYEESGASAELDFTKYPKYGYARLEAFPANSYDYTNVGSRAAYNGTDYLGFKPGKSTYTQRGVSVMVSQYEKLREVYPDIKIYNYFVSAMTDTPWFYDSIGTYPDKQEAAAQYLPEYVKVSRLIYEDFEDYAACNFKTDHHWSYKGAERGYRDVYAMMAEDLNLSPLKYPIQTWKFSEMYDFKYRGSHATEVRNVYSGYDEFIVYEYDLGERETFVAPASNYTVEIPVTMGLMEKYKVGNIKKNADHYINFYGQSYDKNGKTYSDSENMLIIKNNNGAEHSLLMICDSTQRAYRDVIGSHFKNVVTLDYRIMATVPVDYIIEKYDIDTILVGGLSFAWGGDSKYVLNFSENFGK